MQQVSLQPGHHRKEKAAWSLVWPDSEEDEMNQTSAFNY